MIFRSALLIVLLLFGARADANDDAQRISTAQKLSDQATKAWASGDYLTALDNFQKAQATYPSVNLRFNIARVLSDLGRDPEALDAFEEFLAKAPGAPEQARKLAKAKIAVLEKRVGRISLHSTPAETRVTIDGRPIVTTADAEAVRVNPGSHQIAAEANGFLPQLSSVTVEPGERKEVHLQLVRLGTEKPLKKRWWFWTALGGAAVVAATGISLGVVYGSPGPPGPASLGTNSQQATPLGLTDKR